MIFSSIVNSQTIDVDGVERSFLIHVPADLPEGQDIPLVIALHYLGSNAAQFETYTSFSNKADQERFIVAYPQGIGNSWNSDHTIKELKVFHR